MNKQDLLQLEKLATLTPKEIETKQPDLFSQLNQRAGISLKKRVEARLTDAPAEVRESFAKIDFSPSKLGKSDVKTLLAKNLKAARIPAERKKELETITDNLPNLGKLEDVILPKLPLIVNPLFQHELKKARVYHLGDIAGVAEAKLSKALEKELTLENLTAQKLDELVNDKVVTAKEAKDLGITSNLFTFFDNNYELTSLVQNSAKVSSLEDLISFDRAWWVKTVKESKVELPLGVKAEEYAGVLYKKVENLFPESALTKRVTVLKATEIAKGLEALKPLLDKNSGVFGPTKFENFDAIDITDAERKKMTAQFDVINNTLNLYPGLKIDKILNDKALSTTEKGAAMVSRIGLYDKFVKSNSEVNFLNLDYKHDSEDIKILNFQGFKADEKAMVLNTVKAQQRVYSFTQDIEHTQIIMGAGFHSSYHVTSVSLQDFALATKLDAKVATKYFENAHMAIIRTTGIMGSVLDILTGSFDWTAVGNTNPSLKNYLRDIPGYQDLFGELAYCDCEHCQSIYSPAAYLVDLMQFVEQHVMVKHFTGSKANHVLNLKTRRPDLWALELSCENTNTLIPYLDIINEILESYIASKKGFAGNLSDRAAVEEFVYKREIALEKPGVWKNSIHSFQQPFHLPTASVAAYLGHFEKTREDVAILLNRPQDVVSKTRFNLSEKELQLITVAETTPAFINRVFGITFTIASGKINPFNAQLMLKPLGVDRKELERIVKSRYVTNNGADNIVIHGEKISPDSIQNDIERIKNLTYNTLDRIHRYVRLWRKTNWGIEELDLLLSQLGNNAIATDINAEAIDALGRLAKLQETLKLTTEELSGIVFVIPGLPTKENEKSFLDRLFNHDDVIIDEGSYPKNSTKLIHPALIIDKSTMPAEFSPARLSAAFNRSDDEILELIQGLAQPLGIVSLTSATESERGFNLTIANLSLLYRHSKLAGVLKLSVDELFRIIKITPGNTEGYLKNSGHIKSLVEFHSWWKASNYTLDDINYILKSPDVNNPDAYKNPQDIALAIVAQVQAGKLLSFADTVFSTSFMDITESQSKSIIQANLGILEQSPDGITFQLKPTFNPAVPINVPAGMSTPEPELRGLLIKYHPQYLIPFLLSGQVKLSEGSLLVLLDKLGIDTSANAFTLELQGVNSPASELEAVTEKILPLSILFKDKRFNAIAIAFVLDNLSMFGIAALANIAGVNIRLLHTFSQFIRINEDETDNMVQLASLLNSFNTATKYQHANQEELAEILQSKPEIMATLHTLTTGHDNAIEALSYLNILASVCSYIGISGDVLSKIISVSYNELNEAVQAILAAFRSKYKSEEERKEKLEKYQDILRGKKRASLTTYLIHSGFPQFENNDDLFHYFLIDTELEGCARTSRLVAATMSLQLYIHRILLNLEQDSLEPGTLGRVHVKASDIPEDEWVWRKNYRVWEANRKVFLYPENYIEPELRDDKTPLFKELETDLLQQEINTDSVMEAYGKFMRGFDEVAHLKIAGSFHEKNTESQTDVLHLFGVSPDEPPIYYYRAVENVYYSEKRDDRGKVWGPWQKINVQIPVRKVSPITYNGRLHVFWVRITSLPNTVFNDNRSIFTGYSHKYSIEFTTLKLDGTWTPPQKLNLKDCYPFTGNGVLQDPLAEEAERKDLISSLSNILRPFPFFTWQNSWNSIKSAIEKIKTPRYDLVPHYEAVDEYTLQGFLWDQVYPSVDSTGRMILSGVGYQLRAAVDFYDLGIQEFGTKRSYVTEFTDPAMESITIEKNKAGKIFDKAGNSLYRATSPGTQYFNNFAYGSLLANTTKSNSLLQRHWDPDTLNNSFDGIRNELIASLPSGSSVQIINGAYSDAIIDAQGDLLMLTGSPVPGNKFILTRLGTTLSETLTRTLFTSGVDTTLNIATQKALKELASPVSVSSLVENRVVKDKIDFRGPYGNYYREIFFHIPFLIANHLNSQGKYADAQKWYHYIFNPTATEVVDFSQPGLTAAQKKKMELDRNWQYLEFREIDTQKLRDQLNDKEAIEVYKKDPFNPHAIARLRMSAYQKSIVMKYIDNLLDWGDQLFTRDTMESVNEATLLYIIAREILGNRPAQIGGCGEGKITPKNYETIKPHLNKGSEFLAEIESYTIVRTPSKQVTTNKRDILENTFIKEASKTTYRKHEKTQSQGQFTAMEYGYSNAEFSQLKGLRAEYLPEVTIRAVDDKVTGAFAVGTIRGIEWKKDSIYVRGRYKIPSFGRSIFRQVSPVFCVPGNKDLLDYYNRVDDRLFKIRNCMNIQGQRRQLALFAPEIDPRLLVRAKAAGLSLDDVLNSISGNLPPYRFSYIVERARAFTSVVQSFGSALWGALEKKNGEELALLRLTQQQNILEISSKSRQLEIKSAEEGIKTLNDRKSSLIYQIGYYEQLAAERTNNWETAQQWGRHGASVIRGTEALIGFGAGLLSLIPQVGSPFAMKYGGVELGGSMGKIAFAMSSLANLGENIALSAGLEAGFERRNEGWKHQKKVLEYELKQTEKNLVAAEIRRDILIEAEMIHQKNIQHHTDVMDFYGEKFSNLGLYTYLSATMQRLFKEAYNNALSIARLAEQAYRYERDDNTIFIDGSYFDSSRAGLLAGEKLLMALQAMERRYFETNYRKNEIDQKFSLTQINPAALTLLKQTGSCEFTIPELFFDLFYQGQYRRKIQSVRLTIPCITGPYTNVSATLSLMGSKIRMEPKFGAAELKDIPKSRTTIIATSTAQNDAGVFNLNFRDDRYMPFEGAGAISTWKLSLPRSFRQFDYNTINDVSLHISYTAEYDELFRDKVEELNDAIEGTLVNILKGNPMGRVISLRQEFSTSFTRLVDMPAGNPVALSIEDKHFPLFLNGKPLKVTKAKLVLVTPVGQTATGLNISLNGVSQTGFTKDTLLGDLYSKNLGSLFNAGIIKEHTISVTDGGSLKPAPPAAGMVSALDDEKLLDIMLYLEYSLE